MTREKTEAKLAVCPRCGKNVVDMSFCACGFDLRYGSLKKQKNGKCLYCDETRLSSEHIYGKWLLKLFERPAYSTYQRTVIRQEAEESLGAGRIHALTANDGLHPYHRQVLNVCEGCNGGWMSGIHRAAQPYITELAEGRDIAWSDDARHAISRWVAMICINLQSHTRPIFTTELQLQQLKSGRVPEGFLIHIRPMESAVDGGFHDHRPRKIMVECEGRHLFYVSTFFVVERISFHAVYGVNAGLLDLALQFKAIDPNIFNEVMIWPHYPAAFNANHKRWGLEKLLELQDQIARQPAISSVTKTRRI